MGSAEAWLSIINLSAVLYITEREQGLFAAQKIVALVDQLPIRVVSAERPQTFAAAHVKARVLFPMPTPSQSPWRERSMPMWSPEILSSRRSRV